MTEDRKFIASELAKNDPKIRIAIVEQEIKVLSKKLTDYDKKIKGLDSQKTKAIENRRSIIDRLNKKWGYHDQLMKDILPDWSKLENQGLDNKLEKWGGSEIRP